MTHHRVAESKVFFETRGMNLLSTKVIETALAIIFSEQGQDGLWNQGQVRSYVYSYDIPTSHSCTIRVNTISDSSGYCAMHSMLADSACSVEAQACACAE
jgi:hypothetical protein